MRRVRKMKIEFDKVYVGDLFIGFQGGIDYDVMDKEIAIWIQIWKWQFMITIKLEGR